MNLLAISTSTPRWSVWLHRQDGWQRAAEADAGRGTGQRASLTRMVWNLLAEAGIQPGELQRVVADTGPGSFTGLRQGLALARALAWAHATPTHGVSSLHAMTLTAQPLLQPKDTLAVALAARVDVDFVGLLRDGALVERVLCAADSLAWWQANRPNVLGIPEGDHGRALAQLALSQGARLLSVHPDAEAMGRWSLAQPDASSDLAPRYLAVSEAEHHAGVAVPEVTLEAFDRNRSASA